MAKNYMGMKNEELFELIEKYDLDKEDYLSKDNGSLNRKKLSNILKLIDIQAGRLDEVTLVDDEGDVKEQPPVPTRKFHKHLSGIMAQITFYNTNENDLPYVQLGLNGLALMVPREKKVWIPKEFIDGVLQNAIATSMKMQVVEGKIKYIPKNVNRVQYTVHDIKHINVLRKEYDESVAKEKN